MCLVAVHQPYRHTDTRSPSDNPNRYDGRLKTLRRNLMCSGRLFWRLRSRKNGEIRSRSYIRLVPVIIFELRFVVPEARVSFLCVLLYTRRCCFLFGYDCASTLWQGIKHTIIIGTIMVDHSSFCAPPCGSGDVTIDQIPFQAWRRTSRPNPALVFTDNHHE